MSIQLFTIAIPQTTLDDLRERQARTRWLTETAKDAGWTYGLELGYMRELVSHWQHQYNWRKHEAALTMVGQVGEEAA
jgi:Epoxide hydrolase N terminus